MDNLNSKNKIKSILAEHLGIDSADINDQDSLINDLHMDPAGMTDFTKMLEDSGFDVSRIELTEVDTFEDIAEALDAS